MVEEFTEGFPGINGRIPADTALISEVLAERGWNTYCLGKWHLTPLEESNLASTRRHWPLSRGFERFYGFLGGDRPVVPRTRLRQPPGRGPGHPGTGLSPLQDLADKAIRVHSRLHPGRPGQAVVHLPVSGSRACAASRVQGGPIATRAPSTWATSAIATSFWRTRRSSGSCPETELSPVSPYLDVKGPKGEPWPLQDTVRPWDSLSDEEKRLFARMAEVFAGFLSYTDAQIGRVLDYLEESGQLDNTLIVVISDNGASGEGGPNGSVSEAKFFNGYIDTVEDSMQFYDELGLPSTYNHYPIGWAMAFNTPYKLYKRYASHGAASPTPRSSPGRPASPPAASSGQLRQRLRYRPTVYDLLGIDPPDTVRASPRSRSTG